MARKKTQLNQQRAQINSMELDQTRLKQENQTAQNENLKMSLEIERLKQSIQEFESTLDTI